MGHYGSTNINKHYSHLQRIQRDIGWYYWWFNKTFLYRQAKNYQFLIQEEIQSYHWSKEYCKLHPLVVYYLGLGGSLQHDSLCFIPDDNIHYTSFLYQVQTILVDYLKPSHPHMKKTNLLFWRFRRTVQKLPKLYEFVIPLAWSVYQC